MNTQKRGHFSGNLGLILATAGSAIGLGNLWRFPYLAAKGGGLFLLIYVLLSVTFGFTLMSAEIALGRKTGVGALEAYGKIDRRFSFIGWLSTVTPIPIFAYYCVVGGWVVRYTARYALGEGAREPMEAQAFLNAFLASPLSVLLCFGVFLLLSALVVWGGVEKGIEATSRIVMPLLVALMIGISIYSLTLSYTADDGSRRTAWEGVRLYLVPSGKDLTLKKLLAVIADAAGQLFYSLGIAMGVLITFGSYAKKDGDLPRSIHLIEWFDTGIAFLAGLTIIPAVYVFQGIEELERSGPALLFVSLPTVFEGMGSLGFLIGALFFVLVLLAALTSSVSLLETVTASLCDRFALSRRAGILISVGVTLILGGAVCLSYNLLPFTLPLPNGIRGTLPTVLEYLCNNLLLPVVALLTCILLGWITPPKIILEELKIGSRRTHFWWERTFEVMLKFICPILLTVILLQAVGVIGG